MITERWNNRTVKRKFSAEQRRDLAARGEALPDGSYPTPTLDDLANAIQAYGRAPEAKRPRLRAYLTRRARALNAPDEMMERIANIAKSADYNPDDRIPLAWLDDNEIIEAHKALVNGVNNKITRNAVALLEAEMTDRIEDVLDYVTDTTVKTLYLVAKADMDVERRFTLAPLYAPMSKDAHGEWTDPDTLQRSLWKFVRSTGAHRTINLQHTAIPAGEWVEAVTWPYEVTTTLTVPGVSKTVERKVTFPAGTTYLGVVWEPWAFELVKSGKLRGLSLGGSARKIEADFGGDTLTR